MLALHPPRAATPATFPAELPIQSRVWHLFCQGYSYTAIGELLGLERHTISRHVRAVEALLAAEHADDLALARNRALEAAYNLLAITMEHLDAESHREDAIWREYEQTLASPPATQSAGSPEVGAPTADATLPPVPVKYYRAGHSRLLGIALAALRHAIRLSGLDAGAHGGGFALTTVPLPPLPPPPSEPASHPSATAPLATPSARPNPRPAIDSCPPAQQAGEKVGVQPARSSSAPTADSMAARASTIEQARAKSTSVPALDAPSRPVTTPNTGPKWNMPARSDHAVRPPNRQSRTPTPHRKRPGRR